MKKIKIIHLVKSYTPNIGGVEKHLQSLNQELSARNYEVTVITEQTRKSLKTTELVAGTNIIRFPISYSFSGIEFIDQLQYKIQVWTGVAKQFQLLAQADIIQIHDIFFWILPILPILPKKKLFMTFHGYEGGAQITKRQKFWHRLAYYFTNQSLAIGHFHNDWYGVQPAEISFGAVELGQQRSKKKSKFELIYIGRLHPDLGIMSYLKAFRKLQSLNSKYHLDIYGEGELREVAREYCKKYKLNTTFHGTKKSASHQMAHYKVAFISGYLSILEALAAGTMPVCYFNNRLRREYLTLTPFKNWIKIVNSPEAIVEEVLQNHKLDPNATKWAKKQSWQKLANLYENIWRTILDK